MQETKIVNTRNYMMTVEDGVQNRGQIQSGARVPVPNAQEKRFQYMDVGVNINCYQIVAHDDYLSINTTFELSSFALPEQSSGSSGLPPVLRQARASMNAVVPVNKQTVIGTIDDVNSTKNYEIAVTATKLK
jgi:hypothetical protein